MELGCCLDLASTAQVSPEEKRSGSIPGMGGGDEASTASAKIGKDLSLMDQVAPEERRSSGGYISPASSGSGGCEEASTASAKIGKFKRMKESGQSPVIALNKFTSQIKKPSYRKSSPLSWFPRKKGDSYLNRKIKLLQEVGGMNSTLDEALGGSNPHYSKVLREKIAVREAASKAMEARKAALVEASWCRILQAARIQNKEAQALLLKAEKNAAEALEAAKAIGVIMYDKPNCSQKQYEVETSCVDGGRSTTHTVTASFETAFEVDKEVASAVKSAFLRLACSSSLNKDELKDLLRKINQNPDKSVDNVELSEFTSNCESESKSGSEPQTVAQGDGCSSTNLDCKMPVAVTVLKQYKKRSPGKLKVRLVDTMLERLKCLQEDELSSLATIVATCGLSAALAESGNSKLHDPRSTDEYSNAASDGQIRRKKEVEQELPSLDKFLVKRMSKLEREVQEAKNTRKNQSSDGVKANKGNNMTSSEAVADLGSIFVKHSSKLEREIEEAKKNSGKAYETIGKKLGRKGVMVSDQTKEDAQELPSLDKLLVKHVSRLEKEVQEAKNRRKTDPIDGCKGKADSVKHPKQGEIGDYALNNEVDENSIVEPKESTTILQSPNATDCKGDSTAQVEENPNTEEKEQFVKQVHRLEREKIAASSGINNGYNTLKTRRGGNVVADCESLDKVLVKHVSKLEKEKMKSRSEEEAVKVNKTQTNMNEEGGLDQILVKHKSRLEKEKMAALSSGSNYGCHNKTKPSGTTNTSTNTEGLDKVFVKHVARLQKAKMKASSEEAMAKAKAKTNNATSHSQSEGGLDQILVKHKSRLEMEKMAASQQPGDQKTNSVSSRREARERELREAWEGLSLGDSTKPRLSKLEREKADWVKAEEEEKTHAP